MNAADQSHEAVWVMILDYISILSHYLILLGLIFSTAEFNVFTKKIKK